MTERGFGIKADTHKAAWEADEFPQLCESCLGENPYVRMMKDPHGQACKICARPFTVFRWKPGKRARYKKTEICQTCARMKNVCQTCILDLQFNLPVQVRDAFLANEDERERLQVPESEANREWFAQQHNRMLEQEGAVSAYGKITGNHSALLQLARAEPYYKRNRPHLCSFFARGECTRGETCPYLHEMPRDKNDLLAKQNLRDRFYGKNDPVANKMLQRRTGGGGHGDGDDGGDGKPDADGNKPRKAQGKKARRPPPPPPPPSSALVSSGGAAKPRPPPPPPPSGLKPPPPPGPPPSAAKSTSA